MPKRLLVEERERYITQNETEVAEVTEQITEKLKKAERINGKKGNLKAVQTLLR